jgi:alkaline phosphatase D
MDRRRFLAASGSLAAAAVWSNRALGFVQQNPTFPGYPFQLGVASGDPEPESVVLWTRLAPHPLDGGGMPADGVEVGWQVAEDERMTRVVRQGTTVANPEWGHCVHVEVEGLRPDRWYWYQFRAGREISPLGRTRTLPAADAAPAEVNFAFASCQHYETGYFTAYEHMLRDDLDLVLHLGDYIYENAGREKLIRKHVGPELNSLVDYRNRHAQYRTDPALRSMHAAVPWIVTWDDHELANNYAGAISERSNLPPEEFLKQRARAYQAYYEHMPLRNRSLPHGPDMQLYRRLAFGQLADFFVLDTRQYRTDQPCGDGNKPQCPGCFDPNGTLLGPAQRQWLQQGLTTSRGKWNVLAQQIMMARVNRSLTETATYSMDQWPGYEWERRQLLKFIHDRQVTNVVTLAGDIHSNWANDLIADFDDLDSRIVATEFVGTSISSGGDGKNEPRYLSAMYSANPFVKFHNTERGYVRCRVTPSSWQSDYQVVEYVTRRGAPLITRASYVVESGQAGIKQA